MIEFFHTGIKLLFYSLISYCFFPFQLYIITAFLYLPNCAFSCEKNIRILQYYLFIFYVFVFSESRSKVHANKYYWLFAIQKCPWIYEGVMDSSFKCTRKYWWYSFWIHGKKERGNQAKKGLNSLLEEELLGYSIKNDSWGIRNPNCRLIFLLLGWVIFVLTLLSWLFSLRAIFNCVSLVVGKYICFASEHYPLLECPDKGIMLKMSTLQALNSWLPIYIINSVDKTQIIL